MVETRGLDFENVFVLGANEDTLPGTALLQSYIPWDVRFEMKMPMPDDRDATYAYTFYRLMQRATNVHFYYSSVSDNFSSAETSRYIQQLENELLHKNDQVTWSKNTHRFADDEKVNINASMANDTFAKQRLDALFASGISPSAIGKFNKCPLDFYYRYIIGLGEAEEVEEQIGAATFGSIVHDVLETFYVQFKNNYPKQEDFLTLNKNLVAELTLSFSKIYSSENIHYGTNGLAFSIAEEMLRKYIKAELKLHETLNSDGIKPMLIDVEFAMLRDVDTAKYGWNKPLRMRGKGDRIEEVAGKIHILDYKTGRVKKEDYIITKNMNEIFEKADTGKVIQLLSYLYLYCANGANAENVCVAFYSFLNHSKGYSYLTCADKNNTTLLLEFEQALVNWAQSVYSLDQFEHNENSKYCQYCGHSD